MVTFPRISGNLDYYIAGIDYDRCTGSMFISANSVTAFEVNSEGLTG